MARTRIIAGSLLVLVAATGFAGGVVTERFVLTEAEPATAAVDAEMREGVRVLIRGDTTGGHGERRVRFLLPGRLAEELELTPQQQAEITRILAEDQAAIRELTAGLEPALVAVVERSRQRIHAVLTEDQIARWQAMPGPRLRRGAPSAQQNRAVPPTEPDGRP